MFKSMLKFLLVKKNVFKEYSGTIRIGMHRHIFTLSTFEMCQYLDVYYTCGFRHMWFIPHVVYASYDFLCSQLMYTVRDKLINFLKLLFVQLDTLSIYQAYLHRPVIYFYDV